MPLDPSIIANSMSNMAANMPDVNALMQQRVQGMENIYKLETARQAQAQQAQKEQQAAIAQMMLPSVAAAFSDPSDAGLAAAASLMPPEVADTFAPFMDRLRGVPDPKLRQALLRAELLKDDEGKLILAQLEPTANMRLQAATAAQRAAIDMRSLTLAEKKQALEERGEGAWEWKEGADENGNLAFAWVNPRTREVILADITGTPISGAAPGAVPGAVPGPVPGPVPIPAPLPSTDLVTPRQPAPGAPQVAPPISVEQPPAEQPGPQFKPKPKATGGEITQTERRAAALLDNVVRNAGAVNQVITETPEAFQPTAVEAASGFLPWGERQVAAWQQTPERKIVYNRMLQSIDALLTLATGAAYTKPQLEAQLGAYLPGFFDENAVKRDKVLALRDRIESEKINAGRAWTPEQEARAEEVFRQFEMLAETMSQGKSAGNDDLPKGTTSSNW